MYFINWFKKKLPEIVLLLLMQVIAVASFCQDNLNALTGTFNQHYQHSSIEQLFVHTDKDFYLAGEILWFKAYAVDVTFHKPINVSKVVYAELLDSSNKPVLQAKIGMNNGTGNGSLFLPLTLNSGNYKFRAYTNWMKNNGADYFFEKVITVVNVQKGAVQPQKALSDAYDIQFFPEGGNLVAGLESKIAFKVMDGEGQGVTASGVILDNSDTVGQFVTSHAGMGSFKLTPQNNHTYKAVVQTRNGRKWDKILPAAYASGAVMHVTEENGKVNVHVQSNSTNAEALYLLVYTGASVKVARESQLQSGSAIFNFNTTALGSGISHIILFNASRQPLCERIYFKKPDSLLNITLLASQKAFAKRNKVNITVTSPALPLNDSASLSMAVYRLDSIQSIDENTIATYLFFTAGLKGNIEDPAYYFSAGNKQAVEDLDNLLIVNGWSRFKWEEAQNNSKPMFTYVPEYNGHIVTGKVVNSSTGLPQPGMETYLSVPGLRTQLVPATSDSTGSVRFEMKDFYGSSEVIAQTKVQSQAYKVQINNPFSTVYTANPLPIFQPPITYPNTLLQQSISMQVQNIYAANKRGQMYLPALDTLPFYITPDSKYNLDDYTRFTTMEEVIREYVTLVNLDKKGGKYHIQNYDKGHDALFTNDPLILLDGVPVFNVSKLLAVDPLKVKSLEVVQKKYYLGPSSFDGILNWKTYNGDLANLELDPSAVVIDYEGLQPERAFYMPEYENNLSSHIPDFRNVLYWNPNINLQHNKDQVLSFYTSDLPGRYAVVIQGVSASGLCGSTINTIDVNE